MHLTMRSELQNANLMITLAKDCKLQSLGVGGIMFNVTDILTATLMWAGGQRQNVADQNDILTF